MGSNGKVDFGLSHLEIEKATIRLDLPEVGEGAYLDVRPATEANPDYQAALLASSAARQTRAAASPEDERSNGAGAVYDDVDEDRSIYPGNVIVGWGGIRTVSEDGTKQEAEFSADACAEFLRQLPRWLFIRRVWVPCRNPQRFIQHDDGQSSASAADIGVVAKNS